MKNFNKNLFILNNYICFNNHINTKTLDKSKIKILYCNRISFDKNLIMVLHSIKNLSVFAKYNIEVTLLAGGKEYSNIEYKYLLRIIKYLEIDCINVLPTQKDVASFYLEHDFCF